MNPQDAAFHDAYLRCSQEMARRYGAQQALVGLHSVPGRVLNNGELVAYANAYAAPIAHLSPIERGAIAAAYSIGHRQLLAFWSYGGAFDDDEPVY